MDLCKEAEAIEDDIFISIRLGHLAYRFQNGEWSNARSSTPKYWPLLKSIPPQAMELLDLESQFVSTMPGDAKHQAPNLLNCYALRSLSKYSTMKFTRILSPEPQHTSPSS